MKYVACLFIFLILITTLASVHSNNCEGFFNSNLWQISMKYKKKQERNDYDYSAKKVHRTLPSYAKFCANRPRNIAAKGFVIDPIKSSNVFYNKNLTMDNNTYNKWIKYKNKENEFWIPPMRGVCPKGCVWDIDNTWSCNSNVNDHDEHCDPNDITSCYGCDICNHI